MSLLQLITPLLRQRATDSCAVCFNMFSMHLNPYVAYVESASWRAHKSVHAKGTEVFDCHQCWFCLRGLKVK